MNSYHPVASDWHGEYHNIVDQGVGSGGSACVPQGYYARNGNEREDEDKHATIRSWKKQRAASC